MATQRQKVRVGVFAVIAAAIFISGLAMISGFKHEERILYRIEFEESVLGLGKGGIVEYLGVPVGEVDDIRVVNGSKAQVDFMITKGKVQLHEGVEGKLVLYSLATGTMAISLSGGDESQPELPAGAQVPATKSRIEAVSSHAEAILADIGAIADKVRDSLEGLEDGAVTDLLEQTHGLLSDGRDFLTHTDLAINDVKVAATTQLEHFGELSEEARLLVKDVRLLSEDLRGKIAQLDPKTTQGQLNDVLGNVGELVQGLQKTADSLELLTRTANHKADNLEYELRQTLRVVNESLEAVRELAGYLQDDPSALVRGKGQVKGE